MPMIQIQLLAIIFLTSIACTLPGNFLILSGTALIVDAISHAILLGIVTMFLVTKNIHSPFLYCGAILAGLLTVTITEMLISTKLIKKDAAIGLTFPFLFSIAVILINVFASNIHLDTDAILLGELAFTPFDRLVIQNTDLGPVSLWTMGIITMIQIIFIRFFYKELTLSIFDPHQAKMIGYKPQLFHYLLMTLASISIIGAFNTAGTILVVALIIIPPATAYLLSKHINIMIPLSCLISLIASNIGYLFAHKYNSSIAGAIASTNGAIFGITLIGIKTYAFITSHKPKKSFIDNS